MREDVRLPHIFVDAYTCPVEPEVYCVSRYRLDVAPRANTWIRVPNEPWITIEVVGDVFDVSDDCGLSNKYNLATLWLSLTFSL